MKKSASAAITAKVALLSALLNIFAPPDHGRHDVVGERDDAAKQQDAGEEAHQPHGLERHHGVDEGDRGVVPLPALPEAAEPERYEEAQAADHEKPETPVGQRVAVELGVPHARHNVISPGHGEEGEAS